ncbi:HNH endonuclease [Streptomyces sp. NPDC096080]|uniref:HNH endonuclease n=1 Tax=Streptomyces sp. NPDC096080 TaxID=3156693 RepID=UPI003323C3F7
MSRRHRPGHLKGDKGRRKRVRLAAKQDGRCFDCRRPFADPAAEGTIDHYIPYALWPANASYNLVVVCAPCNVRKADGLPLGLLLILWPLLDRDRLELVA